ncbi:SDR family oxidoreductase [Octadecabacter sp. 1_MG-2023]|uniref:SDR family oxidoreductase n=1 Tax=unclassified Octadecabacter TaxID=196158 RepID=UPI001C085BCC|nr:MULTISPECIES: SDR family oxidoreductase [unclassified Octadecabacter]MBU2991798.1 SDR family oxidoreductase [Octadecabacter sp. B2R22]MDO6735771.1 SDR family oxidoreductase [Octadecabacter sp. 1_MG-2023]
MKSIIITGASSGIGRTVAEKFLAEGWTVGLIARREQALRDVAGDHANAHVLPCDVTDADAVEQAFASFAKASPQLDVLFNNAGIFTDPAPIDEIPVQDWLDAVNVNLTGMFLCARAAFGAMRHQSSQGGRIINNGSVSAHTPREGSVTYTTTKHGVSGLTKTLALDGRPFDIACGQIDIGNAESPMINAIAERNADAGLSPPPMIEASLVADAIWTMANLPLTANTLFQTLMATQMPFVGRG